ncbi:hem peroxidase [Arabidopsis thaliana x Arabidopsis arenosa]|uniref:peroxidase n=1 Tax=Arabidopsis thaliana x Arabidopsis arenosa TaxID=1240361 RepID=A0A8T1Z0J7_9BRAS|nr:hem peroxidase [Arabidopsis thaliana x Arabidopsis arenosa]
MRQFVKFFPLLAVVVISLAGTATVEAATGLNPPVKLVWHYYKVTNTCDDAESYIRYQVEKFYKNDSSIAPKLLRLLYSDCMVNGCDASVLLQGPNSERTAPQNRGLGGFVIIDKIKQVLESRCPGVVSCADILNLATRDAVHMAGAPSYPVFTGRRDGGRLNADAVDLPSPSISVDESLAYFKSKGLDVLDMTTLLGAHSMGKTHCSYIVDRLYNFKNTGKPDPTMNSTLVSQLRYLCPPRTQKGQTDPLVYLNPDSGSSNRFTSSYYSRVLSHNAVLRVDQELLNNDDSKEITQEFASGFEDFRKSFALAMSRMGSINVLTGTAGEIRRDCRVTNANYGA